MYPSSIEKLIRLFSRFPTVGMRTATRFAFYITQSPKEEIEELICSLQEVKCSIRFCKICFRSIEGERELCSICQNKNRRKDLICLVEKEVDLVAIEKTQEYEGIYFILGGAVSPLKKEGLENIRVKELRERIKNPQKFALPPIEEIIIATNQTPEGEATALYIIRALKSFPLSITRLGRGLPTGGELEYADEETLSFALKGRS